MGRLLPGERTRKNDGTISHPTHVIHRTPVSAATVQASTQGAAQYAHANQNLQRQQSSAGGFYASRPAGQRKAMRDSVGVLSPKAARDVQALHLKRVQDVQALQALAQYEFAHRGRAVSPPTALQLHGLALAEARQSRHGGKLSDIVAPFRTVQGVSGSGQAGVDTAEGGGGGPAMISGLASGLAKVLSPLNGKATQESAVHQAHLAGAIPRAPHPGAVRQAANQVGNADAAVQTSLFRVMPAVDKFGGPTATETGPNRLTRRGYAPFDVNTPRRAPQYNPDPGMSFEQQSQQDYNNPYDVRRWRQS